MCQCYQEKTLSQNSSKSRGKTCWTYSLMVDRSGRLGTIGRYCHSRCEIHAAALPARVIVAMHSLVGACHSYHR